MSAWRLLDTGARPGAWNMACDVALLEAVERGESPATVRVYAWSVPAVSLGRHQPDPDPAAAARLTALGVDWVRRPTGGRAVWHGLPAEELTYSVVARLDDPSFTGGPAFAGGLHAAYRRIHEGLAEGLARIGVAAALAPRARRDSLRPTSRVACFAASVPYEIIVGDRKLVGSAQCRSRTALLQHGSIPLAGDQGVLTAVWPGSLAHGAATTVSSAAGRAVEAEEVARAVVAGLGAALGVTLAPGGLATGERATIATTVEPLAHHGV